MRRLTALGLILCAFVVLPATGAAAQVQAYRHNDGGGFQNILPPGQNGLLNAVDLAAFATLGVRPPHSDDQLGMYRDGAFKDASFGIPPGDVASTITPRRGVTILRDRQFGVPRVYGVTRSDTMFGAGYAGAQDRLFAMDVLRHAGRAQLSSFAGGANRAMDAATWEAAPYREEDFQRQYDMADEVSGAEGRRAQQDVSDYVAGINAYIAAAKLDPLLMPAEYAALGRLGGPDPWNVRDVFATATLIFGIFGSGGGSELDSALALQAAQRRFGRVAGSRVWRDFRAAEDPEAPVTVLQRRFPYEARPAKVRAGSVAMPDRGSVTMTGTGAAIAPHIRRAAHGLLGDLLRYPATHSNALLVSARESASGHPLLVAGPQLGYFNPQIAQEIELHGPGIDARGVALDGLGMYVNIGRGRDYAWSPTSAGQDITDTFAVDLCEPDGSAPTGRSMHYRFRGRCLPIDVLERVNSWRPSLADSTPAGTVTLRAERTKLGLVTARATIHGKPVVYTKLRSTYMHEGDSALGISLLNDPGAIRSPQDFQRAAFGINTTFHWFYADSAHIAYFNSGADPVRAKGTDPNLPVAARFEWRGFDPDAFSADYEAQSRHPGVIDQAYIVNWNNKSARGYRASDSNWTYTSLMRSLLLEDRVRAGIAGPRKMTLTQLVAAMQDAATVDLRADKVLPFMLRVLGTPRDPRLRAPVAELADWARSGAHRRDANGDHVYEHSDAIRVLDAWWPLVVKAQFEPTLGRDLYERVIHFVGLDNAPHNTGTHVGSAYQSGSYGVVRRDLRAVLGARVPRAARYSRRYCGGTRRRDGTLRACRAVLERTLAQAVATPNDDVYGRDRVCDTQPGIGPADPLRRPHDQFCWDSVWFRPNGAAEQPVIPWVNRPTFQQAVEVQGAAPR